MMRRMRRIGAAIVVALMAANCAVAENSSPIVVELYTSQGCSSCPPADAFLRELAGRDDVLALALHVDYWDYIGWADSFAQPRFSRRQQAYARTFHERMVYTPQMIVGGLHESVGTRTMKVMDLVELHEEVREDVDLTVTRDGDALSVRAEAGEGVDRGFVVQLVRFKPDARVEITRGENAGHTLDYANIVTEWAPVANWSGEEPLSLSLEVRGADRAAIILQRPGPGKIVAAAVAD